MALYWPILEHRVVLGLDVAPALANCQSIILRSKQLHLYPSLLCGPWYHDYHNMMSQMDYHKTACTWHSPMTYSTLKRSLLGSYGRLKSIWMKKDCPLRTINLLFSYLSVWWSTLLVSHLSLNRWTLVTWR